MAAPGDRHSPDEHWSARPLEDAYRIAAHDLVTWLAELTGLNLLDTYQLVGEPEAAQKIRPAPTEKAIDVTRIFHEAASRHRDELPPG